MGESEDNDRLGEELARDRVVWNLRKPVMMDKIIRGGMTGIADRCARSPGPCGGNWQANGLC